MQCEFLNMAAVRSMCSRHLRQIFSSRTCTRNPALLQFLTQRSISNHSSIACVQLWNLKCNSPVSNKSLKFYIGNPAFGRKGHGFATDNSPQKGSKITDEILNAKLGEPEKKSDGTTEGTGGAENKEKKKDRWYSGKNAWKLGLLSLAGMGVLMGTNLLILWGESYEITKLG